MILVVSSAADVHAAAVLAELGRHGADAYLLDLSLFPGQMQLSLSYDPSGSRAFGLRLPDGQSLDLADCRVIWWRRPQAFVVPPAVTRESHRMFALSESHEAFAGLWQAIDPFWVNHPTRDAVAAHKVYQLRVAQEVGLAIPRTLVSNDPEAARAFVESLGHERTIYKAFSATMQDWRETRLLRSDELALLDNVRYAPVIFQEYIEAQVDLRVTIMGDEIFPAAIYSQETSYKVDFRMDIARARIEAIALPDEVTRGLKALMARLGLVYGAVDMRLTPDGQHIFLEINPAGQWLFIEQVSRQPMTAALARLLAKKDRPAP